MKFVIDKKKNPDEWHPPGGNVYLVNVDSAAGDSSQAGGEREKGDHQGVVAAYVVHGHEEGCRGQHGCREIKVETRPVFFERMFSCDFTPGGGVIAASKNLTFWFSFFSFENQI